MQGLFFIILKKYLEIMNITIMNGVLKSVKYQTITEWYSAIGMIHAI